MASMQGGYNATRAPVEECPHSVNECDGPPIRSSTSNQKDFLVVEQDDTHLSSH